MSRRRCPALRVGGVRRGGGERTRAAEAESAEQWRAELRAAVRAEVRALRSELVETVAVSVSSVSPPPTSNTVVSEARLGLAGLEESSAAALELVGTPTQGMQAVSIAAQEPSENGTWSLDIRVTIGKP